MSEDLNNVMRRIQKLLAIAQDTRANPAEAAAAAAMAEKVMRKYQIEHADLVQREVRGDQDAMTFMDVQAKMKMFELADGCKPKKVPPWSGWLAYHLAKLHDCELRYVHSERGVAIRLFGYRVDVQVAAWTFDYLVQQVVGGLKDYQRGGTTRSKAESESFRRGFVLAVCNTIDAAKAEKDAAMAATVTSRALVVSKAVALAERYGEFNYRTVKSAHKHNAEAYCAGRAKGQQVKLTAGINGDAQRQQRIH